MGTGNSKDKKDKKAPKEDAKAKGTATAKSPKSPEVPAEKAPAPKESAVVSPKTQEKEDDDIHESWNDQVLFARTEGTKAMTKDDFEVIATIGKGSFGKVLQVRKKDDGATYAMKILRKEAIIARKQVAHTKAEKSILSKIQHPFIVRLHFAFQTKDKLYMVLDFVNGGELFFHLKNSGRFPENRVKFYSAEIICAIAHLHSLGIVYRDLKPENILLDSEGHICITDFGLSKEIKQDEGTHTFCGTPEYLAPEVLKGQGHGTAVDWWSLGTLIYEMLTGLPPFYSQNINMMYQKILNAELKFPSHVSPAAQDLLTGLLTRDPEKRLGNTSEGSNGIRKHPFFADLDWEKLAKKEIEPPFKPGVRSKTDISQIDTMFTGEKAVDSVVENSTLTDAKDAHFDGFTYVSDNVLNA